MGGMDNRTGRVLERTSNYSFLQKGSDSVLNLGPACQTLVLILTPSVLKLSESPQENCPHTSLLILNSGEIFVLSDLNKI